MFMRLCIPFPALLLAALFHLSGSVNPAFTQMNAPESPAKRWKTTDVWNIVVEQYAREENVLLAKPTAIFGLEVILVAGAEDSAVQLPWSVLRFKPRANASNPA
jgi:hypothetical protein